MSTHKKSNRADNAPHPRPVTRWPEAISAKNVENIFSICEDFEARPVLPGLEPGDSVTVCWLDGIVDSTAISEDILRPLTETERACDAADGEELMELLLHGAIYSYSVKRRDTMDELVDDIVQGFAAVIFDGPQAAITFEVRTQNSRAISMPTVEKSVKGAKDAFVETLRTNTSLVRRKLRTPSLKIKQSTIGRQSLTSAAILYVEGIARDETVDELMRRLDEIDIDGLLAVGDIEEYIIDDSRTPLPQLVHTERADAFAMYLLDGRVGLIADGLPVGFLVPGMLADFMRAPEDESEHYLVASMLSLLRWFSLLLTLTLPALLVAVSVYHQEMLPTKLLLSMVAAKQRVPFSVGTEVLTMLIAFELLQEAGLRLPDPIGQTVSIIGALIVGQSAVEARVVSPIAVIVVALAGIAGYTTPSQDLSAALRVYRFLLVFAAIPAGLFGVVAVLAMQIWRLCTLESFGTPYTAPFTDGDGKGLLRLIRRPLSKDKFRNPNVAGSNLRRQK